MQTPAATAALFT
uniref:Uncharacterized protein n=1 Tax=Anguilla anguilla TaxID=7936 RepID=A0A0E9TJ58_ANGAN